MSASASASSAYTSSFDPNPPPTSGAMIRSFDCGMPVAIDNPTRQMCGICVADTKVNSPAAGIPYARHPRGSIAFGISRGCV